MNKFILTYHGFGVWEKSLNTSLEEFEKQVNYLLTSWYKCLDLKWLLRSCSKCFHIVFDDWLRSSLDAILLLEELWLPYGLALITNKVWREWYLSIQEIIKLKNKIIYSHSINHYKTNILSEEENIFEISKSKLILEQHFSCIVDVFVYPYWIYNNKAKTILREYWYLYWLSLLPFHLGYSYDPFQLPRLNISWKLNFYKFKFFTSYLWHIYLNIAFIKRKILNQSYLE